MIPSAQAEDFCLEITAKEKGETTVAPKLFTKKNEEVLVSDHNVWAKTPGYAKETGLWAKATPRETANGETVWNVQITKKSRVPSPSPYPVISTKTWEVSIPQKKNTEKRVVADKETKITLMATRVP